jgi:hypothetical protein
LGEKRNSLASLCVRIAGGWIDVFMVYANKEPQWEDTLMCEIASLVMSK